MKILSDFFRLRTVGARVLLGGRKPVRRPITVTVPRPLVEPAVSAHGLIDQPWQSDGADSRAPAHWHAAA
ncbi:MAG: hypothetical protein ABW154_12850 [Dyella sp.]